MRESSLEYIARAMKILDNVTPLKTDCGTLCGGKCCQGGDHDGMWLIPGEEKFLKNAAFLNIKDTNDGKVAICSGSCDRELRPFSCRIYPYFPMVVNRCGIERIRVVPDIRALNTCALFRENAPETTGEFKKTVARAGRILLRHPDTRQWLYDCSDFLQNLMELQAKLDQFS